MISSIVFANTIELKEVQILTEQATSAQNNSADVLKICYETSRKVVAVFDYFTVVEVTYLCFDHPEWGNGPTIYVPATRQ